MVKKRKISVASAKGKGRRLQNWVAQKISDITGYDWGKDKCIAPREMGQSGTDVRLVGSIRELFPFAVECKNQETWSIPQWIRQAKSNIEDFDTWLLFIKKNHHEPLVVMDAEKFFELYCKLLFHKGEI